MARAQDIKADKINKMKPSVCTCEWGCSLISHKVKLFPAFLNCRHSLLFKMVHWCNWYDFLIKLQKLWSDADRAVMDDQLMDLVLSCNTGAKTELCAPENPWKPDSAHSTATLSFIFRLQGVLKEQENWRCEGMYVLKCAYDWKTPSKNTKFYCLIKFLLLTRWQKTNYMSIRQTQHNTGISLEFCFLPPDKWI